MNATNAPRVLAVTADVDPTADLVLRHLVDWDVPFTRFDPVDFPQRLRLDAHFRQGDGWSGRIVGGLRDVELEEVRAVYYRRPGEPSPRPGLSAGQHRWCLLQAGQGLWGVLRGLRDVRWVNHPERVIESESKPYWMEVADRHGLNVPATLVTNDPAAVKPFAVAGGGVVTKAMAPKTREADNEGPAGDLFTARVSAELFDDPAIAETAHLFQTEIDKACEVRAVVVGNEVFAVRIDAHSDAGQLDYRRDYENLTYSRYELPDGVAAALRDTTRALGLAFAAVDVLVDHDGVYWCIDINPNGQWAWLEFETGVPISTALARALTEDL